MHVGTQCLDFQDLRGTYETAIFAGQGPTLLIGASDWGPGLYDAEFVANVSRVAFKTCAGNLFTAGDGGWPAPLQWPVVAETDLLQDWEIFTVEQQ